MSHNDITRLRYLEAVALFATVLAVGLTALLEPATAAVENNPVARSLLETLGWTGAGIVAVGGEALLFAGWRRLSARGYRRAALAAGSGVAVVGVVDVLANLSVLARVGLPETARVGYYGGETAVVAVVAVVVFVRPDPRRLAARITIPHGRALRATALAGLLVLSALAPVYFGTAPVNADDHADGDDLLDDFEDGPNGYWGGKAHGPSDDAYEGTGAGNFTSTSAGDEQDASSISPTADTYSALSWWMKAKDPVGRDGGFISSVYAKDSGGNFVNEIKVYQDGHFEYFDGSNKINSSVFLDTTKYYKFSFENIDYSNNKMDLVVKDANGNTIYTDTDISTADSVSDISVFEVKMSGGDTFILDYIAFNGKTFGQEVSGNITDSDGNPIDGGTLELRQSGSVVSSTTAGSDGSYSLSGVSDGEYTVRVNQSGYRNKSASVSVSGSAVSKDVTLRGNLQGFVTGSDGSTLNDATLDITGKSSVGTNSSGGYDFPLTSGDYTVEASASGYQNKSVDVSVNSPATQNITLAESGTYVQTFKLDDETGAFPYDETAFIVEKRSGGEWKQVTSNRFNSNYKTSVRLEKGDTYRYRVKNVIPNTRTAEFESAGWIAGPSNLDSPERITYEGPSELFTSGGTVTATPTGTGTGATASPTGTGTGATATPTGTASTDTATSSSGGGGSVNPSGDADGDGTQNWWDRDDDGDGVPDSEDPDPDGDGVEEDPQEVEGPTFLSTCEMPDGSDGLKIEYYDPTYETESLDYNVSGPNGTVYNGTREFEAPVGYWQGCVGDALTDNVTDAPADEVNVTGNATNTNGTELPFEANLAASGAGGGGFQSFGPTGDPATTPVEQATAFGLAAAGVGLSFLLSRRTNVLENIAPNAPVDPVFAGGSVASLAFGLEFASGGVLSAALANGLQRIAPLAGIAGIGLGAWWFYRRFILAP